MTDQTIPDPSHGPGRKPLWRRRPSWSVIGGIIVGAAFTFGYLVNSLFYCSAQFSCAISPYWIAGLAVLGIGVGALWGWLVGKFFRGLYRITRVD